MRQSRPLITKARARSLFAIVFCLSIGGPARSGDHGGGGGCVESDGGPLGTEHPVVPCVRPSNDTGTVSRVAGHDRAPQEARPVHSPDPPVLP